MPFLFELERRTNIQTNKRTNVKTNKHEHLHFTPFSYYSKLSQSKSCEETQIGGLIEIKKERK